MISKIPGSTQVTPKDVPGAQPPMTVLENESRDPGRKKNVPKNGPKNCPKNAPDDRPKKRPRKAQFSIPENFTWTNFQLEILCIIFWTVLGAFWGVLFGACFGKVI